ncbi:MAG: ribosome recycling factor [Caldicoprobacterales bacterium]|jgi:ribosome recycling factor|nr:ribosome recycling factor [Clostridiales bacterium]
MLNDLYNETRNAMSKAISKLNSDLSSIRAGRANPKLLDRITVDYYGVPTPINQLGNISVPEPRLLVIAPWEPNIIPSIEKEILKSDLGITPNNDGKVIRLVFPELTEERRKDLVKVANKMGEEAKVAVRMVRRNANDKIKKMKKGSEFSEDELKAAETEVQKITDDFIKQIDEIIKAKEKDIMEV